MDLLRGRVDDALVDRMNYHYTAQFYRKRSLLRPLSTGPAARRANRQPHRAD